MWTGFKMVKPEIPLALDGGMNGVRSNYHKLLEKQKIVANIYYNIT